MHSPNKPRRRATVRRLTIGTAVALPRQAATATTAAPDRSRPVAGSRWIRRRRSGRAECRAAASAVANSRQSRGGRRSRVDERAATRCSVRRSRPWRRVAAADAWRCVRSQSTSVFSQHLRPQESRRLPIATLRERGGGQRRQPCRRAGLFAGALEPLGRLRDSPAATSNRRSRCPPCIPSAPDHARCRAAAGQSRDRAGRARSGTPPSEKSRQTDTPP